MVKRLVAIVLVAFVFFSSIPVPVSAGGGISPVTVTTCVDKPMELWGQRIGKHLDLVIQGSLPNQQGLWITLDEIKTGKRVILGYYGPSGVWIGHELHGSAYSIRGSEVIVFQRGYEYTVTAWTDTTGYTLGYPTLTDVVWGAGVTMPSKNQTKCGK